MTSIHRWMCTGFPSGGGPVIDLSHLNGLVRLTPFKMETVASVLLSVREGDFLSSIDLKDAYFQIPVHQSSRKLLRFLSEGTVYQFKALCFGLSTAPQVFTSVFPAVSAWAHSHGIRLLWYLDDWLVLASSEAEVKQHVQYLLSLCHSLRIVINEGKSDLVPSQTANYLGMTIDTGVARIFPSLARVEKFLSVAETFCALTAPPAQLWQVLLGHLASLERLVSHGRLRMRSLQWHLKTHWSPESDPSFWCPCPRRCGRTCLGGWCGTIFSWGFDSGHLLPIYTCTRTPLDRGGAHTSSIKWYPGCGWTRRSCCTSVWK